MSGEHKSDGEGDAVHAELLSAIEIEFKGNEEQFMEAKLELEACIQADNSDEVRQSLKSFLLVEPMVRRFLADKVGYTKGSDLTDFITAVTDLHDKLLALVGSNRRVDFAPFMRGYRGLATEERPLYVSSLMDLILSIREGIIHALPVSAKIKTAFASLIQ
jgi:hypothetical protein